MTAPICTNCKIVGELVTGREIYPHRRDLYDRHFWQCSDCDRYVGTHKGTTKPLGLMADDRHRKLKQEAHYYFDQIWKNKNMSRSKAYQWITKKMKRSSQVHIGWSTETELKQIIEHCKTYTGE